MNTQTGLISGLAYHAGMRPFIALLLWVALSAGPLRATDDCTPFIERANAVPPPPPRFDEWPAECVRAHVHDLLDRADAMALARDHATALAWVDALAAALDAPPPRLARMRGQFSVWRDQADQALVPAPRVQHLFTHSLIIDPARAFDGDFDSRGYDAWMLTDREFVSSLERLYAQGYVLVDVFDVFEISPAGRVKLRVLQLPAGKRPLLWSFDDVNFYSYMRGDGFAERLAYDRAQEIPILADRLTDSGALERGLYDAAPLLEHFLARHPDFSWRGARAIIAVTGFEGVLGYRTRGLRDAGAAAEARRVAEGIKAQGWRFASHSFGHQAGWRDQSAGIGAVRADLARWRAEVAPVVGDTPLFVGPFGTIWRDGDARRAALVGAGFRVLFSVDAYGAPRALGDHAVMGRLNVDGFRMKQTPRLLAPFFDVGDVIDPRRPR